MNLPSGDYNQEKYGALVSVIIPAYNGEHIISSSVKSVLNQSYKPLELIIIDDASVDGTYEKLCILQKELRANFLKVLKHEKNLGLAATLNHGIRESKGKYILVLHQDCELIGDNWISKSLRYFEDNRVAVVTGYYGIPPEKTSFIVRMFGILRKQYHASQSTLTEEVTFSEGKCDIYKRDILEKIGLFPERYKIAGEDLVVSYSIRQKGYALIKSYELPVLQRFGHGATTLRGNLKKEFIFGKAMGGVFGQFKFFLFKGLEASSYSKSRSTHRASQPLFIALFLLLLALSVATKNQFVFVLTMVALVSRLIYYCVRTFKEHKRIFNIGNRKEKRFLEILATSMLGLAADSLYTFGFVYGLLLYAAGAKL